MKSRRKQILLFAAPILILVILLLFSKYLGPQPFDSKSPDPTKSNPQYSETITKWRDYEFATISQSTLTNIVNNILKTTNSTLSTSKSKSLENSLINLILAHHNGDWKHLEQVLFPTKSSKSNKLNKLSYKWLKLQVKNDTKLLKDNFNTDLEKLKSYWNERNQSLSSNKKWNGISLDQCFITKHETTTVKELPKLNSLQYGENVGHTWGPSLIEYSEHIDLNSIFDVIAVRLMVTDKILDNNQVSSHSEPSEAEHHNPTPYVFRFTWNQKSEKWIPLDACVKSVGLRIYPDPFF